MKTKLNLLMAGGLVLSACGTLKSKKTMATQELQSYSQQQQNINQQSWAKSNTLLADTSNSEYVLQITPLGKFLYSTEKGFEGMAESVVLSGKASNRRRLQRQQQTGDQLVQQKKGMKSTALETRVQHAEKTGKGLPTFLWIGLGLIFCLTLGYRLMKKR
ncbi:hypothetical protein [uncultured Pedobacter sp.]|uniref:hypothetical protein n=1 Tax=uncultured Pedobacter sp. TaxID=246139 RepID=UPI0025F3226F|nr:hypothetical protein [uncultured Pedobacter sp.]